MHSSRRLSKIKVELLLPSFDGIPYCVLKDYFEAGVCYSTSLIDTKVPRIEKKKKVCPENLQQQGQKVNQ